MSDEAGTATPRSQPGGRPSADEIEGRLGEMLRTQPDALVAAIGAESMLPARWPSSLPLPAGLLQPDTMTGAVVPDDRAEAARLIATARADGLAFGRVRLRWRPDRVGDLSVFDLHQHHGVIVAVFVGSIGAIMPMPEEQPTLPVGRAAWISKDVSGYVRSVDATFTEILGWSAQEAIGHRITEFVHPDDQELGIAHWVAMLAEPGPARPVRLRHRRPDGTWVWVQVTNCNRLDDPLHQDILTQMVDVSEELAAHEAVRAREQLLGQMTETLPMGLFHVDLSGRLLYANRRLYDITGVERTILAEQLAAVVPDDRPRLRAAVVSAMAGSEIDVQITLAVGGDIRHCSLSLRPLSNEASVIGLTGCLEDVTEMVRTRRELEARAVRDPLTGCLNRDATFALLEQLLGRSDAALGTAVIFVDVDGLKPINDQLGHAAGDELLMAVATRLRESIRSTDVLGRFGGDEFVIVCDGVPGPFEALAIAQSLQGRILRPVDVGSRSVDLRASMGVAWSRGGTVPAARLIKQADEAMYTSKRAAGCEPVLAASIPS